MVAAESSIVLSAAFATPLLLLVADFKEEIIEISAASVAALLLLVDFKEDDIKISAASVAALLLLMEDEDEKEFRFLDSRLSTPLLENEATLCILVGFTVSPRK